MTGMVLDHTRYTLHAEHLHIVGNMVKMVRFLLGWLRRSHLFSFSLAEKGTGIDQQKKKPKPRGVKPTLPSQYHLKFV